MAELAHNPSASEISENIGDVLASIRRLIAQDEANRSVADPGARLRQLAQQRAEDQRQAKPSPSQNMGRSNSPSPVAPPLVLGGREMVGAEPQAPLRAQSAPGPIRLPDPPAEATHRRTAQRFPAAAPTAAPVAAPTSTPAAASLAPDEGDLPADAPHWDEAERPPRLTLREPGQPIALTPAPQVAAPAPVPAPMRATEAPEIALDTRLDLLAPESLMASESLLATDSLTPPAPVPAEPEDVHFFAASDDLSPTEALLRDLIREAIRDELQGKLGGQFSRNLRRVIRSEVELALQHSRKLG